MSKKVLVVGGGGYIGSHVSLALLDKGYEPVVLDNFANSRQQDLPDNLQVVSGNFGDPATLTSIFQQKFCGVIHLAALKAVGVSMEQPQAYAKVNIIDTITLLNAVLAQGIPFIFSSSAAVYGDPKFLPITEEHPLAPASFYGFTKQQIENVLHWYSQLKQLSFMSLRYFNVVGYDEKLRVKGLEKKPENVLPILMEAAIGKRQSFKIFGHDYDTKDGTAVRDYVHVTDIAHAHALALEYLFDQGKSTALNLGSANPLSVKELAEATQKITQTHFAVELCDRRPGDTATLYASCDRAKSLIGWQAQFSSADQFIRSHWAAYQKFYRA